MKTHSGDAMDHQPTSNNRQPWQSNLGFFLIAVVFLAIACLAVEKSVLSIDLREAPLDSHAPVFWLFAIPIALSGAIGILRGHLKDWLCYGVLIDLLLLVIFLPSHMYTEPGRAGS